MPTSRSAWARYRRRTWELFSVARPGDTASLLVDVFIIGLILLNVVGVVIETVPSIQRTYGTALYAFEIFSVTAFTIEYVARVWSCIESPEYNGAVRGRLRFMRTPLAIIDVLAVAPFYLPILGVTLAGDLRVLRALRLLRIVRVAKLGRYLPAFLSLMRVVKRKKEELVLSFTVLSILLVIAASLMFYAEHEAQPEIFSSIPATMWWAVATLTTVGYGDVYPVTVAGKVLASAVAILGIGLFALPAGILASGLQEEWAEMTTARRKAVALPVTWRVEDKEAADQADVCPHCGEPLHAKDGA